MKPGLLVPPVLHLIASVACMPGLALGQDANERELARVRAEIAELEAALGAEIGRRDDGAAELRQIELSLVATRAEIAALGDRIATQESRQREIEAERAVASGHLKNEQVALAEQVRMSYMTGREEILRLLLGQDGQADLSRMLVYYDYLSRHRSEQIGAVRTELARLIEIERESDALRRELEDLRSAQERRLSDLEQDQKERLSLLARLDQSIATTGSEIERMRAEETTLNELIAEVVRRLEAFPVESEEPFSEQRGRLPWPVEGRIVAQFGDPLDDNGLVRQNGVLIEAEAGTIVRAIYHGQVRFAQWAPGMGLLLIIDHGEGLMSLYGHNAALLRELGDWVAPGDPIAEVGDTGGRLEAGLYFGIRQNLEPLDPSDWVR